MTSPESQTVQIISMRVADGRATPAPLSSQAHCAQCGAAVWVSPASRELAKRGQVSFLCSNCYQEVAAQGPAPEMTPETRAEIKALLGLSDEQMDDLTDEFNDDVRFGKWPL